MATIDVKSPVLWAQLDKCQARPRLNSQDQEILNITELDEYSGGRP